MSKSTGRRSRAARPPASSPEASRRMRVTGPRDTAPEKAVRSALHRLGLRFRVDRQVLRDVRRRADIVFGPARVAVFIDGCFWHSCPEHGTMPKANGDWWKDKLARNRERDADTDQRLAEEGWRVIRVWEHEDAEDAANGIAQEVRERRKRLDSH